MNQLNIYAELFDARGALTISAFYPYDVNQIDAAADLLAFTSLQKMVQDARAACIYQYHSKISNL